MDDDNKIKQNIKNLQSEHQKIDDEINNISKTPIYNELLVQRLKKQKLTLKDQIIRLQNLVCDDIIA